MHYLTPYSIVSVIVGSLLVWHVFTVHHKKVAWLTAVQIVIAVVFGGVVLAIVELLDVVLKAISVGSAFLLLYVLIELFKKNIGIYETKQ